MQRIRGSFSDLKVYPKCDSNKQQFSVESIVNSNVNCRKIMMISVVLFHNENPDVFVFKHIYNILTTLIFLHFTLTGA